MFSQLGPLFKTVLRQTEQTDARLQIRREDKDNQGKKQEFEEKPEDASSFWEDTTSVSVGALRTFLIEFLKSHGDPAPEEAANVQTTGIAPVSEPLPPSSNIAARAIKAYSSMQPREPAPPPPAPPQTEEIDLLSLLEADELRTIHVLIAELDLLARRGVETLTIEKADSFLESLVQAVRAEKQKT